MTGGASGAATLRRTLVQVLDVLVAVPLFVVAPLVRRWHLRWGATDAERDAAMPGDDLVPRATFAATRAVTIAAGPEAVWAFLVQVGYGRAGFYSYALLDNAGRESPDRPLPQFHDVAVGDPIPMTATISDTTAFRIAALDPPRAMLWRKPDSTWAWSLTPLPGGRTRLVTRLRARPDRRHPAAAIAATALLELGDFPMMRRMLLGIRSRAEHPGLRPG